MLIGLAGRAGSGKDSVGTILKRQHGFTLLALAYPIKEMICGLLKVNMDMWDDRGWRETMIPLYGKSPRQMAQTIGTEWGRGCVHPSMWLDRLLEESGASDENVAITDVRFDNEAHRVQQLDGFMIKVVRPETTTVGNALHTSEDGISDHMIGVYTIKNFGSLDELSVTVQRVLNIIRETQDENVQNQTASTS